MSPGPQAKDAFGSARRAIRKDITADSSSMLYGAAITSLAVNVIVARNDDADVADATDVVPHVHVTLSSSKSDRMNCGDVRWQHMGGCGSEFFDVARAGHCHCVPRMSALLAEPWAYLV